MNYPSAHAQAITKDPHTPEVSTIGIEDLTVPIPMIVGAFVIIIGAVGGGVFWLGRLQQRLAATEEDMSEVKQALHEIQESLDKLGVDIEAKNKEFKKELLAEIKKQSLATEGNIDSAFQPSLIKITLTLDYLTQKLNEREATLNQIKSGLNRIGAEAREAKSLGKLMWEMNCANGPPSKPHNYNT